VGSEPPFTAHTGTRNGVAWIALGGELDQASVAVLNDHLTRFEQDGLSGIMLDLRELTFVDRSGLSAFVQARKRAQANGHQLLLLGAGLPVRRLLELTRTQFLLEEQDAVGLLDRFTGGSARRAGQGTGTEDDARV
jgi:anti-sigma B factor antagonist